MRTKPMIGVWAAWVLCLSAATLMAGALSESRAETAPAGKSAVPGAGEVRGVWIHTYSPFDWEPAMRRLRDAGFNSVFVRVGRGGNVIYPSALLPRDAWAEKTGGDELQRAITAAHRYGLDFHAWRVCYHMRSAPKEYYDRMAAEDRLVRDADGKQSYWANPADPRNADLEYKAVMEIAEKYDVEGIHLDYIRYPDAPHWDFDYGSASRAQFERTLGRKVANWPADVINGPLKRAYEEWEREGINRLMERVYRGVKAHKPKVQVSAAVWRNHRRYRAVIKQDWPLWVERGWMDFVVPMDYTAESETFADTVKEQVAMVAGRMPVVAGIGAWLLKEPAQVAAQVEIARAAGADGYCLFALNAVTDDTLDLLAKGAQRQPAHPAYHAPRIAFGLRDAVARKDAPFAVTAERPFSVEARLRRDVPLPTPAPRMQLRLETLDGRCLAELGAVSANHQRLSASPVAASGIFQIVARGKAGGQEVVTRGPLLEGLTPAEVEALRAREHPPQVAGAGFRVGVYDGGIGAQGILAALRGSEGICALPVYRLRPDHLAAADALVLPQLRDTADFTPDAEAALRNWVSAGGTLLLTHDAVGFRWHPPLFTEIGMGSALARRQPLQVLLPDAPPETVEYAYQDHVRVNPAPGATVLARESGNAGAPVIVGGALGKGRVVLCGFLPGVKGDGTLLPAETRLLQGILRVWRGPGVPRST